MQPHLLIVADAVAVGVAQAMSFGGMIMHGVGACPALFCAIFHSAAVCVPAPVVGDNKLERTAWRFDCGLLLLSDNLPAAC